MAILSPTIVEPLSECNRSVNIRNTIPGAKVILVRVRQGISHEVGSKYARMSEEFIDLDSNEEFVPVDLVTA
ncbi:hypothetical protein L1279_000559 [Planomicrobium sp. HSC-17F08]|nr:hypothetical protein [Planomicrobium sp. HSC-17F08]